MEEESVRTISTIEELVEVADLTDVVHYEVRGNRVDGRPEGFTPNTYSIEVAELIQPTEALARYRLTFQGEVADYLVDVAAKYSFSEPIALQPQPWIQFVEEVAFMVVFPFLREGTFSTATRLGQPAPVLGLMKRGEFRINPDGSGPEPSASS